MTLFVRALALALVFAWNGAHAGRSAAGCYIALEDGVVMNVNRKNKTVELPIGRTEVGESLQETAARETWEETGLRVEVGRRLLTLRGGEVALFFCTPTTPVTDPGALAPVFDNEIDEVLVLNPHTLQNHDGRRVDNAWRHPPVRFLLRALFAPTATPAGDTLKN